jgi:N-acetylglucosamine kinase-like BadF-type ATPase
MGIVIGIDGGGTTTKALAAGTDGRIIGYGESGPANCQTVGMNQAGQAVWEAVRDALGDVSLIPSAYFLGMAGVGRAGVKVNFCNLIAELAQPAVVTVETDAYIALAGGTICRPGVVVIAGTGAVAFGVNPLGREAYSGGWGYLLGDEGSAYDLGRRGMIAVLQESDGRGPATALTDCLLEYLGLPDRLQIDQIIRIIYRPEIDRRLIADFAPMVTREADAGDRVALRILKTAAWELSLVAGAVLKKLNFGAGPGEVIITGGVFDSAPLLVELFTTYLKRRAPDFAVVRPRFKPVVGALLLALKDVNGALDGGLLERLAAGLPEKLKVKNSR